MTGNITYGTSKTVHLSVRNSGTVSLCGAWKRFWHLPTAEVPKTATDAPATCKTCQKARRDGRQEFPWTPAA